ncbi:septum formation inhibitor Maf [Pseudoxanthomonas broegbernensis]|uniref:dTTP/UTP pyrophosphatase n=1 Tax=Pseudoxanthomonas broegbernensis TaxID=83619 RepID=A0A7V8K6Q6_9GAMM|nr:Maf family protein [Pseudoxanthomonas broegbernensis]KAF1686184.1 septum formation inhibitor Maf [Pseudoxanthomonas broegbernensis]MBB6063893.1 septum formation protein [Pseudoxanthomonas broegbernensis]
MLYLASKSPRRAELLQRLGLSYRLLDVDVPESRAQGEGAADYVRRVARDKARAGWAAVSGEAGAQVLGADTEVVLDDEVFGKPADEADAAAMLRRLSGRTHTVLSAVVVVGAGGEREALSVTEVRFAPLADAAIQAYVATGEAMGKAGAYAIQGCAEVFVEHLSGSYSGVMGLPLHHAARLLAGTGPGLPGARSAVSG